MPRRSFEVFEKFHAIGKLLISAVLNVAIIATEMINLINRRGGGIFCKLDIEKGL